MTDANL